MAAGSPAKQMDPQQKKGKWIPTPKGSGSLAKRPAKQVDPQVDPQQKDPQVDPQVDPQGF